jgi:hypothetical protein
MRRLSIGVCAAFLALAARAPAETRFPDPDGPDAPAWKEDTVLLPGYPDDRNLIEFYVSETTLHRFFIDGTTLSVGKDGVVRYVVVIRTGGGARNVNFEGIRCETREFKLYASGRLDGTWTAARRGEWRPIENKPMNRHHAALSRDFFCPSGTPISDAEEGRDALRRGKHPQSI